MAVLLDRWETIKNDKTGKNCNDQQKHFLPFVISVDRMLGRDDLVVLVQLSQTMADKMEKPPLKLQGWVNGRIKIVVPKSYSYMICRAQLPSPLWESDPDWDMEIGIGLAS